MMSGTAEVIIEYIDFFLALTNYASYTSHQLLHS